MFKKILIANRGEIACRVIKTARRMGIATVAVYSDADRDALHVGMADEAIHIGPPEAVKSYLDIGKIVDAAGKAGAEAIHPGYGFLSENAAFARALKVAGIVFIGPNIRAIEIMGDKIQSKAFAAKANINTVPGHPGIVESAGKAVSISDEIGYPVMIKASAGGGGKGMRIAFSKDDVAQGFASARSEAKSSFGDDRVFIEKFIESPRHIEFQVLADAHGHVIHLGERECSIQRRNQKVLEEAPSPFLDEETRVSMGAQAVALAAAVDYQSVGTVEFIVDNDRNFYFLEMNTRLQVEHPVTELITGLDLVEHMIRVANGEPLSVAQEDVKFNGWAIESRIYAEDPFRNFLPSTGRLVRYRPPLETHDSDLTTRIDTGVYEGGEISIYYDPMIAKLVVHGPDREQAIDHMARALDSFLIDGIQHNIPFLSALMQHPRWCAGDLSTNFIADEYPDGFSPRLADGAGRDLIASIAVAVDHVSNTKRRHISLQMRDEFDAFSERRVVRLGDNILKLRVSGGQGQPIVVERAEGQKRKGKLFKIESDWWPGAALWHGMINGQPVEAQIRPVLNGYNISHRGISALAYVYTEREAELAALMPIKEVPDTSRFLLCPMPGLVVSIAVAEGQQIRAGDHLCVVEAMKMENVLRAERDGVVRAIKVMPGDSLAVDAVIMEFE